MAYGDEKVAIRLRDGEKYGALIETGEDGEERTYYPRRFAIHLDCEKLQVRQGFAYREENDPDLPKMFTYVTGVARLTSDHNVSVIGEPKNSTTTVKISFRPDDSPDLLKKDEDEQEDKLALRLSKPYGRAHMGFNRADWEIQSSDQWWLECRLHPTALQPLIDAISSGTLEQASLSVRLNNLFTDQPPFIPFLHAEHLFLRPNKSDNTINMPEMANGWLEGLGLGLRSVAIAPPSEPGPDYEQEKEQPEVADPAPQPAIQASQLMATHIDALRGTMKWVGGLIVIVLLLLLFK